MAEARDPVEAASDETTDLYDVATWEARSALDRFSALLYGTLASLTRGVVVLLGVLILLAQVVYGGFLSIQNPAIGIFILLSVVPALAIALYVWRIDVTTHEPIGMLVFTFLLGIVLASFAAVLNGIASPVFTAVPVVGLVLFFYLIVGPIEETVKWLAVRLYAYRSGRFDAVIDGAVYGAMAGLGFATIENAIYIGQQYLTTLQQAGASGAFGAAFGTAAVRTFAGPGHVIYSSFAGYYLGLAKFNPENAGPIVVKGLVIAVFIHATYNTLVSSVPAILQTRFGVPAAVAFLGFVLVYDGVFGYWLYRKLARYRRAFHAADAGRQGRRAAGDPAATPDRATEDSRIESGSGSVDSGGPDRDR